MSSHFASLTKSMVQFQNACILGTQWNDRIITQFIPAVGWRASTGAVVSINHSSPIMTTTPILNLNFQVDNSPMYSYVVGGLFPGPINPFGAVLMHQGGLLVNLQQQLGNLPNFTNTEAIETVTFRRRNGVGCFCCVWAGEDTWILADFNSSKPARPLSSKIIKSIFWRTKLGPDRWLRLKRLMYPL